MGLWNGLVSFLTITLNSFDHRIRIDEHFIVGIDKASEGFYIEQPTLEFCMSQAFSLGPFRTAAFVDPHATDVFQETCCSFNSTLIGEILGKTAFIDNGFWGLNAHQTPRARTQVSKIFVLSGNGSHSACRVVTSHCDHGNCGQSRHFLYLRCQPPYDRCRFGHRPELLALQS